MPAPGSVDGLIHASTDTTVGRTNDADDGTITVCAVPENAAALSGSLVSRPVAPSVTPPWYVPGFAPALSAALVPDASFRRQYPTGPSAATLCAYVGPDPDAVKVAVTVVAALMVSTQVPVPVQPPPVQPPKVEPAVGAAVNVTLVPGVKDAAQVAPHAMPAGAEVTVPVPVPLFETVSWTGVAVNVAVTVVAALIVSTQVPVPVQPPPVQPPKVEPAVGAAVNVTLVPVLNDAAQVAPHAMPAGDEVTVPVPVPLFETVSCTGGGAVEVPLV